MADILSIAKKFNRAYDANLILQGDVVPDYKLMPTRALAFDYALKGGLPLGRIAQISGPAHSGKTTLACLMIAAYQRMRPNSKCVYVDAEHAIDLKFQSAMTGMDLNNLIYINPDRLSAEQIFDIITEIQLNADDVGMIVIDSVPSLISNKELDNDIEKDLGMSGHIARPLHRFCKTMSGSIHTKDNMLLFVNQVRTSTLPNGAIKYSEPGGKALEFYPSVNLRCGTRKFLKNNVEVRDGEGADGFKIIFSITKNKVNSVTNGGGYVTFSYNNGVNYCNDAIDVAINAGYILRPSNVSYEVVDLETGELLEIDGKPCKFTGKAKLLAFFEANPEFTEQYVEKVIAKLTNTKANLSLLDKTSLNEILEVESKIVYED